MDSAAQEVQFRRATEADVDGILTLLGAVADEGRWLLTESAAGFHNRREGFVLTSRREDAGMFVAVSDHIVGELSVLPEAPGLYGLGMAVEAAWRARGVGSGLMEISIAWVRSMGGHKITLEVFPHNLAAIKLYKKYGFESEGYRRKHYRRRDGSLTDAIAMGLLL